MFEIKYDSKKDLIEKAQVAKPTFSKDMLTMILQDLSLN